MADLSVSSKARALAVEFRAIAAVTTPVVQAVMVRQGLLLAATVKRNASGRPGPRTITGDYRRSWTSTPVRIPFGGGAVVGSDAPQARRLEYGFNKADSLGRRYRQPAFPHLRPAVTERETLVVLALDRAMQGLLRSAPTKDSTL